MATITHFDIGDIWRPQATFTVAGVNTDPTTLIVRVQDPSGTITVTTESSPGTLTSVSSPTARTTAGVFVFSQALDEHGHWYLRFEGTGAATASEDHEAVVDPTPFYSSGGISTRALVGLGETKDWLSRKNIDTGDDLKIVQRINAASERIIDVAGREFKPNTAGLTARSFDVSPYDNGGAFHIGDLATLTSATASFTDLHTGTLVQTLDLTADVVAMPRNRKPWEPIVAFKFLTSATGYQAGNVLNVTGTWGFPAVPEDVKHACMDTVAFWLDRDVEHFRQDLGAIPGGSEGGQTVIVGSAPTLFPLPPEAFSIARSYRLMLAA